jgi:pimeloyl-ACP methyl ester carboxylesterase
MRFNGAMEHREREWGENVPTEELVDVTSVEHEHAPPLTHVLPQEETPFHETIAQSTSEVRSSLEASRDRVLLEQFHTPHTLSLPHETLSYTIVDPVTAGLAPASSEWVVFVGGFSSIKENYQSEMLELARAGKRILFLSPDKGATPTSGEADYLSARAGDLPDTVRNKAAAVTLLLRHLGIASAQIIGHSQGGAVAGAVAGMAPGLAKRLILDNPAGLTERSHTSELLKRVREEAKHGARGQDTHTWIKQIKNVLRMPVFRATQEIPAIAHTDIRPILRNIRSQKETGHVTPEVVLINAESDRIFPSEMVEAGLGEHPDEFVDRWAMHSNKETGHGKFDRKPGLYPQIMADHTSVIHQIVTDPVPHPSPVAQKTTSAQG